MTTTGKSLPKKTIPPLKLTKAKKASISDTSLSDSDSDLWQTVESNNKRNRSPNEISPTSKKKNRSKYIHITKSIFPDRTHY
jgi:hypothetical protein